jgi:hypothetical protein
MAEYLVHAVPLAGRMPELARRLRAGEFRSLRPFGRALTESLTNARVAPDGRAVWEEEDYCSPPLAEERAAVLDHYFRELEVDRVGAGEGWRRIADLPRLFPPTGGGGFGVGQDGLSLGVWGASRT